MRHENFASRNPLTDYRGNNNAPFEVRSENDHKAHFPTFAIMKKGGCIYFMTNAHHTALYVGVTSDLISRVNQHKTKEFPKSFTAKYNCNKLVYYESFHTIEDAIARKKNIKDWKREWKDALVNAAPKQNLDESAKPPGMKQ